MSLSLCTVCTLVCVTVLCVRVYSMCKCTIYANIINFVCIISSMQTRSPSLWSFQCSGVYTTVTPDSNGIEQCALDTDGDGIPDSRVSMDTRGLIV